MEKRAHWRGKSQRSSPAFPWTWAAERHPGRLEQEDASMRLEQFMASSFTSKCRMSHSEPGQPASSCFEVSRKLPGTAQVRSQHPTVHPPPNIQSTCVVRAALPCDNFHLKWGICYFVGRRQTPIASIQAQIHLRFKARSVLTYSEAFENPLHPWFLSVVP